MISYQQKQRQLFQELEEKFKRGENPASFVDPVSDYVNDNRICLTSVKFVPSNLQQIIIEKIITPLKKCDPRQYYYVQNSFHYTVQSIKTVSHPPIFSDEDVEKVRQVFQTIIPQHKSYEVALQGLYSFPTNVGICGFSDESMPALAFALRKGLKEVGVADDKTYASKDVVFGNVSICRYLRSPNNAFFEKVKELKNIRIGSLRVSKISLIRTNAVCYPNKTQIIEEFALK